MSLDEVREIAVSMGLNPRRSQSIREISYAILDAQADNRAAIVQAKEDAREAAGKPAKRERVRGVKRTVAKVITEGARSERVIATVGSEKEQMAEMQEQLKANNHRPNKTVVAAKPILNDETSAAAPLNGDQAGPLNGENGANGAAPKAEEAVVEQPKKKRGRPRKSEQQAAANDAKQPTPDIVLRTATGSPIGQSPSPVEGKEKQPTPTAPEGKEKEAVAEQPKAERQLPDLGENVLAMGTLECAPDGYGFLRSADYNYLSSPDGLGAGVGQEPCGIREPHPTLPRSEIQTVYGSRRLAQRAHDRSLCTDRQGSARTDRGAAEDR